MRTTQRPVYCKRDRRGTWIVGDGCEDCGHDEHQARVVPSLPCPAGSVADLLAAIEVVCLQLGWVGAGGDQRICASLPRASSDVDGLALREVAAMNAYGTCHEAS